MKSYSTLKLGDRVRYIGDENISLTGKEGVVVKEAEIDHLPRVLFENILILGIYYYRKEWGCFPHNLQLIQPFIDGSADEEL